ncbi:MAG: hypothetical protein V4850_24685 [Myxococcota bacterium]
MRTSSTGWIPLLAGLIALTGCDPKEEPEPVDTGPFEEPAEYTPVVGVPTASGEWDGQLSYSRVHPYTYGEKGPHLEVERLTAAGTFFEPSAWGVFDLMQEEGCWTDDWAAGWSEYIDIGESLEVQVGSETATFLPVNAADGVLYAWTGENPAQDWAILPGNTLAIGGVDTTVTLPEPLVIPELGPAWIEYFETGTLTLEWEPPTMGETWIYVLRRETSGGYTRCHVRDDGAVSIVFGSVPDEGDYRLFFSRVISADVEVAPYGRMSVYAEDLVLLDP